MMVIFEDIEDVADWLEPKDYPGFWEAIAPYRVFASGDRAHCDGLIADGKIEQDLILDCLKAKARVELTRKLGLRPRIPEPVEAQYIRSVH
ncbi:MAG: hypothetical protein QNJ16_13090 [Rhodobacter sp.]|nr:hypothetical protein [Rhodobacter sp.]